MQVIGSDIQEKQGWSDVTMLQLFNEFIGETGHEGALLDFLNNQADQEAKANVDPETEGKDKG